MSIMFNIQNDLRLLSRVEYLKKNILSINTVQHFYSYFVSFKENIKKDSKLQFKRFLCERYTKPFNSNTINLFLIYIVANGDKQQKALSEKGKYKIKYLFSTMLEHFFQRKCLLQHYWFLLYLFITIYLTICFTFLYFLNQNV